MLNNRKMSMAGFQVVNGELVQRKAPQYKKAEERKNDNLALIVNRIKNRKKVSKSKALKIGRIKLNELLPGNKTSFMSLAYAEEEQQVGKLTAQMSIICSLTKEAWCNEDGTIDTELFYNAFKCCDKKNPGVKDHWDSIYQECDPISLIKNLKLSNYTDMAYDVYYISNIEIIRFKSQLEDIDVTKITYEDIVKIQNDLYHLFRAFQESSIDVVKDKKKSFRVKWDDIIGTVSRIYSKHADDYRHNIDAVMKDRTIKYDIEINSKDNAKQTRGDVLCDALLETHVNFIQDEVLATAEDSVTELLQSVVGTSDALTTEAKLHAETIISVVSASFKSTNSLDREEYKAIRDALYTIVAEEAETAEEGTAMVLDLIIAKYRVDHKGNLVRNYDLAKTRLGCAKMILGGILPLYLNDKSTYTRVFSKKEFVMFQELSDGQRFAIEDADIIADGVLVGALRFDESNEHEVCSLVSDAAYVVDGNLYVECDIYADLDCQRHTVVLDTLYHEASIKDVVAGKANDNLGREAYIAINKADNVTITGKKHNIIAADGVVRARLNDYSVKMLEDETTLEVTADNSIAVHIPYDKEVDDYEYCCQVIVFI